MTSTKELISRPSAAPRVAVPRQPSRPFVIEPRRHGLRSFAAESWRFRYLAPYFGKRFIQKRMGRTWLGMIWLPLKPGLNLGIRIAFFGGLVGIKTGKTPYPIFFLVASAAWMLFQEMAFWSMRSVEINRRVLARVYVPRFVVLGSALIPAGVDFLINMSFAVLAVLYYLIRAHILYVELSLRTLLVPAGLLLMIMLGLGVGMLLSGPGARARDIRFTIHYFFQFAYYATPILYPITLLPQSVRPVAELNPMTGAVEMVKDGLFKAHELSPDAVAVTLIWIFLIWGPGLWLFDRHQVGLLHGRGLLRRRRPQAQPARSSGS